MLVRGVSTSRLTATVTPLDDGIFAGLFEQWRGAEGQALYVRNFIQFDEDHTRPLEPLLSTITAHTAIIWGRHDTWLPVEMSELIVAQIPGSTLTVLPEAGHFSMEDDPAGVAASLTKLLER